MPRSKPPDRNGNGRFVRTVEQAEKDAEIARYCIGRTFRETAAHYDLSVSTVYETWKRALQAAIEPAGDEILAAEMVKLDVAERAVIEVLRANHVLVSDGRLITDASGRKLVDHAPVLAAVREWRGIMDQRAKYRGLYAPTKQTVTVITEDALDAEYERLCAEKAELEARADTTSD